MLGIGSLAVVGDSVPKSKMSLESEPTAILGVFVSDYYWNSLDMPSFDMISSL